MKCPVCRVELSGSSSCFRDISGVVVCDSVDEQVTCHHYHGNDDITIHRQFHTCQVMMISKEWNSGED